MVDIDMAPYIGKSECRTKISVPHCEYPNTYIDLELRLTET
jgi:hypothetical protein